ncbi:MAG: DUF3466 family protein [Propionibacteriaceae bacterium]|jgi:hypothetical protein|nr:DUF3466 family protein [Propionibacteriaceae bacterium]
MPISPGPIRKRRRQVAIATWLALLAAFVLVPLGGGVAAAAPTAPSVLGHLAERYQLTLLEPTNGGFSSTALGLNEQGDVVGVTRPTSSAQPQQTVLWEKHDDHFHAHELANLDGSRFSRGFDLNDAQQIVGEAFNAAGNSIPIRWQGEEAPWTVALNEAGTGLLNDINEAGVAVGTASGRAVALNADGSVRLLDPPGPAEATINNLTATTIAEGDVIGGRVSLTLPGQSGSELFAVVWEADGPRLLTTPAGASAPTVAGVRADGVAVGSATSGGLEIALLWDSTGSPLELAAAELADYPHAAAKAISGGVVVGQSSKYAGNTSFGGAAIGWDSTGAVELASLVVDLPDGVVLQSASDVNQAGHIVGTATTPAGTRGFVLTPVPSQPAPSVEIVDFPAQFVDGAPTTLTAQPAPALPGASYSWEIQPAGSSGWLTIRDAAGPVTGAQLTITPQRAWDGYLVRVALLDGDGDRLAVSAAQEIRVALASPTEPGLHILGLAGHYHSNGPISLTATLTPTELAGATYRWSIERADQSQFQTVDGVTGAELVLTAEQALDGAQVKVECLLDGVVQAVAQPVLIEVDDHGAAAPQQLAISGETEWSEGETITLTAIVTPATMLDRYQWFWRTAGSDAAVPIPGATSATYAFSAGVELDQAAITVAVVTEHGAIAYGTSPEIVLSVLKAAGGQPLDGSSDGTRLAGTGGPSLSLGLAAGAALLVGIALIRRQSGQLKKARIS